MLLFNNSLPSLVRAQVRRVQGIDIPGEHHRSPLILAITKGDEEVTRALLAPDMESATSMDIRQSQQSLSNDDWDVAIKELMSVDTLYSGHPLVWAACTNRVNVAKILLKTGKVEVDCKDVADLTPLLQAAKGGHEILVKLLLDTGKADVNAKDDLFEGTPLSWAAGNGHEGIVKLLLDTGETDVNTQDNNNPLSVAAEYGHLRIVELLLETGWADINVRDSVHQRTPLEWADFGGHTAIAKLLREYQDRMKGKDTRDKR